MKHLKSDIEADSDWGIGGLVWLVALIVLIWPRPGLPDWLHFVCLVIVLLPIAMLVGFLIIIGLVALAAALL